MIRLPRWATAAVIAAILVGWVVGPRAPQSLAGTLGWAAVTYSVMFGLGMMVRRRFAVSMYLGETILVGAGVWIFGVGVLLAVGLASRGPLFALAGLGSLWTIAELILGLLSPPGSPIGAAVAEDGGERDAGLRRIGAVLLVFAAVYFFFNLTGSLSTRGNPADDWVAYAGFVRHLLDSGDLIEPFSFRRLSAYGGQTALLALSALRGDYESFDLTDRGLFQPIVALLLLELARRRKLHMAAVALAVGFVMSQMENRFNSASHWTGIAVFLGAYSFVTREDLSPRAQLVSLFALCGVACTMRQNFIMAAALFAILVLVFHLRDRASSETGAIWQRWRAAIAAERATVLWAIGATFAVLLPYMVAAWRSNHTFLYPVLLGTGNPAAPLRPLGATFYDEVVFFLGVFLNSEPVRAWWLVVPFMLMARDLRPRKPFTALLWASLLAFLYLTHSFMLSDAYNIWRYAAGYMTPLMGVFFAELLTRLPFVQRIDSEGKAGGERGSIAPKLKVPPLAVAVSLFVLFLQIVETRNYVVDRIKENARQTVAAKAIGTVRTSLRERSYQAMQRAIPAGEAAGGKVVMLVDEAMFFDYARNTFVNLDMAGFAAPAPGLPSFLPTEVWRDYFHSQGIRYVVYVDGDYSLYLFRRQIWAEATYSDHGIWRFMATHMVNTIDAVRALKASPKSKVLYDDQGFVAVDLGPIAKVDLAALRAQYAVPELQREYAWLKKQLTDELDGRIWELMSHEDLVFDDVDPIDWQPVRPGMLQALGQTLGLPRQKGTPPRRWLGDRSHLRLFGTGKHRLQAQLEFDLIVLGTRPTVSLLVDGKELFLSRPVDSGKLSFDVPVECHGWCDAYLNVSTIGVAWQTASQTKGIRLDAIRWIPDRAEGSAAQAAAGSKGAP